MIVKLAWRNIGRHKTRSGTVMASIVLGIWVLIFAMGFIKGVTEAYIKGAIENEVSHLQLHDPDYVQRANPQYVLSNWTAVQQLLQAESAIQQYSPRSFTVGLVKGTQGVQVRGIRPELEAATTRIDQKITQGKYLSDADAGLPVLIGAPMGEKLHLQIGDTLPLQLQAPNGSGVQLKAQVAGWFDTGNSRLDGSRVFMRQADLEQLFEKKDWIHEVAIVLKESSTLLPMQERLSAALPELLVQNYREVSPDVELYETQINTSSGVLIFIIMLALIFGIINTMLMAILERNKELGMLLAVGMQRRQVFGLVVVETLLLALLAVPLGLILGVTTVLYLGTYGFDMSSYQGAMSSVGMAAVIYPPLDWAAVGQVVVALFFTALLAALYPAYKATRLQPIEAMQRL